MVDIKNVNLKGKKVIVRVDFNVFIKKGKIKEAYRIERTLPTIELLRKKGAKIILISHLTEGRAESLRPTAEYLKRYFPVRFIADKNFKQIIKKTSGMKEGEVVMLENIRIHKSEENNDEKFAKQLARLGDIFVNDAFSVSHRKHASVIGIPRYLPSYEGLLFKQEIKNLQMAFRPKRPFLLILGGIKFSTKLGVLKKFLKIADKIFVGGALSNNFFRLKGMDIGKSLFDEKVSVKRYLNNQKIILPIDVRKKDNIILDCGHKTVKALEEIIKNSKFILWNGPLGDFEKKGFEKGTEKIAMAIVKSRAISIIGGGDLVASINRMGILKKFTFVSTAGGAMLEFLAHGTLPGIEALKNSKIKSQKL